MVRLSRGIARRAFSVLAVTALLGGTAVLPAPAQAQGWYGGGWHGGWGGWHGGGWYGGGGCCWNDPGVAVASRLAGLAVGAAIGAAIAPPVYAAPPVVYAPPPPVYYAAPSYAAPVYAVPAPAYPVQGYAVPPGYSSAYNP